MVWLYLSASLRGAAAAILAWIDARAHFINSREMRWSQIRMIREPGEEAKGGALGDDHGEASAAFETNPAGRYCAGRIAALLVVCLHQQAAHPHA